MRINDDKAVIDHLFRDGFNTPTKTFHQTLSSFCQWCAETRYPNDTRQFLLCPVCDEGDE